MRHRAGVILIEDGKVALIERHRAGMHYFVFPGGGVDKGETPEQAAVRETEEELGLQVEITRKLITIHFGQVSLQNYFLVTRLSGEFGTGTGEEFEHQRPDDPKHGTYLPIWMPIEELSEHDNVHPAAVTNLVFKSLREGWPKELVEVYEEAQ